MRWTQEQFEAYQRRLKSQHTPKAQTHKDEVQEKPYSCVAKPVPVRGWEAKQTKTEQKYNREVLRGVGRFEPVTLVLSGGSRYTPDFMTVDDGVVTFHEVKGSYRLQSYGRAKTAYKEACNSFPMFRFVWAEWTGKDWNITTAEPIGAI